jgi:hypothetical protein
VHTRGNVGPTCTLDCTHGERAYAASYAGICKTQGPNAAVHSQGNPESNLHTRWYACRMCICSLIRWHMPDPGAHMQQCIHKRIQKATCILVGMHAACAYAASYAGICKTQGPYAAVHTRGNVGPTCTLDCTHGERAYAASYADICKTKGSYAAVHTLGNPRAICILDDVHGERAYADSYAGICKTRGPYAAVHTQGNAPSNLHTSWYACRVCICSRIRSHKQHRGSICSSAYTRECGAHLHTGLYACRACYADSHAGICKTRGPYAAVHTRGNAGPTCTLDCTHGERAYADSYAGICKTRGPYAAVHTRGNAGPTCTLDCTHGERAYAASYAGICKTQGPNAAVHTPGNPESNLHTSWYACRVCICSFIGWHMQDPGPICSSAFTRESRKQPAY